MLCAGTDENARIFRYAKFVIYVGLGWAGCRWVLKGVVFCNSSYIEHIQWKSIPEYWVVALIPRDTQGWPASSETQGSTRLHGSLTPLLSSRSQSIPFYSWPGLTRPGVVEGEPDIWIGYRVSWDRRNGTKEEVSRGTLGRDSLQEDILRPEMLNLFLFRLGNITCLSILLWNNRTFRKSSKVMDFTPKFSPNFQQWKNYFMLKSILTHFLGYIQTAIVY